ncbi:MAG TPA: sigma-70 family RNA polymerase sigma factor [Clostridiaceae bacterium]|nr:sigma-70 family RNA polymerase sigma factor [Clostridiaceae bacterium]
MPNIIYDKLTDQELIYLIKNHDEQATEVLLKKYKNMVTGKTRRLFLQGGDQEDLIQEGMIGLYQAIFSFDATQNVPFKNYASAVVDSRLYDAIRTATRKKHQPLNESLSLDYSYDNSSEDEPISLFEILSDESALSPESLLLNKEIKINLENFLQNYLSKYEDQVASLYLQGKTYREIADKLKVSTKSVDGALQRVRKKLSEYRNKLDL